jgi:hypothetical protein
MTMKPALVLIAPALVVALAACSPTGSPTSPPAPRSGGGSASGSDCVVGNWTADLDDLATQLADYFNSKGVGEGMTGSVVSGSEKGTFTADGKATANDDAVFTFEGNLGGQHAVLTQTHAGGFTSDWALTGDTFDFTNFDGAHYSITSTIEINGTSTTVPVGESGFAQDIPITTTCTDDVMTMKPTNSPFTTTWHRD